MRRAAAALLLALASTALGPGGCAVGPDYRPPPVQVPAGWSELEKGGAAAGAELSRWWTSFKDPVLDSLVARAVASNHDLRIAGARVREARAARGVAAAGAWPSLETSGSYTRIRQSENAFSFQSGAGGAGVPGGGTLSGGNPFAGERDLFEAGFDASWEIDVFGGVRRTVEAAQADVGASEESRRDVLVILLAEVARNYIELRGFQARLAIARRNMEAQASTVELTRSRFRAGLTSDLDVARAEALLAGTRSQVPLLTGSLHEAVHRLGVLVGQPPGALQAELSAEAPLPATPAPEPIGLPSDLLRRRPDVRRTERELAAATARIGAAEADLFPRFHLLGSYGFQSEKLSDLARGSSQFWSLGPSVSWPFFAAGRIRSQVRVQGAREEQALARYEKAVLTSLAEVEDALAFHSNELERRTFLTEAVAANRRAADLAQELYRRGVADFLNVLEAERSLYASEDQLVQSERSVLQTLVALYKALGGGWEPGPLGG